MKYIKAHTLALLSTPFILWLISNPTPTACADRKHLLEHSCSWKRCSAEGHVCAWEQMIVFQPLQAQLPSVTSESKEEKHPPHFFHPLASVPRAFSGWQLWWAGGSLWLLMTGQNLHIAAKTRLRKGLSAQCQICSVRTASWLPQCHLEEVISSERAPPPFLPRPLQNKSRRRHLLDCMLLYYTILHRGDGLLSRIDFLSPSGEDVALCPSEDSKLAT